VGVRTAFLQASYDHTLPPLEAREAGIFRVLPMASGGCSNINCTLDFLLKTAFLLGINENKAVCHQLMKTKQFTIN
jgi:hypothetical protein